MNIISALSTAANTFPISGFENLSKDASFVERLLYGLKFAAIGILTVFLILTLLMAVLYVFKLVFYRKPKAGTKAAPVNSPSAQPAPSAANDEATLVAIATAAIAASRSESDCAFKVISVTKIK